jgi:amidase
LAVGTFLYNVVDSPVGIVPVTRVDPGRDALTEEWKTGPGHGSPLLEDNLYNVSNAPYNPVEMAGLPVGVQIVGRAWEDEKVIEMMQIVDKALGERGFGPGTWQPR